MQRLEAILGELWASASTCIFCIGKTQVKTIKSLAESRMSYAYCESVGCLTDGPGCPDVD